MASIPFELIFKYPLIEVKQNESEKYTIFEGKLFIYNKDYSICIKQYNNATISYELIYFHDEIEYFDKLKPLISANNQYRSILDVFNRIKSTIESKFMEKLPPENHCDIYRKVLHEYNEFTSFYLDLKQCQLNDDLTGISASVLDEKSREHSIKISVNYFCKSKDIFEVKEFDLPIKNHESPFKSTDSLINLFDQFLLQIDTLQPYFNFMDEIDRICSVLDPSKPKKCDNYRRLWMGDNCSVIITVDPFNLYRRPDLRFLGPDRLIERYNDRLNDNLSNWSIENGLLPGILDLIGLDRFPKKPPIQQSKTMLLVDQTECIICYSLRLDDQLPEITCTNKSCEKVYHKQCLFDWLVSINARRVVKSISGNCPNCEKIITCPIID